MTIEKDHPIHWVEGDDYCRWRDYGVMGPEACERLFGEGLDGELHEQHPEYTVIGHVVFSDLPRKELQEQFGRDIRPAYLLETPPLKLCIQFWKDLDDYYARQASRDWSNIPDWKNELSTTLTILL